MATPTPSPDQVLRLIDWIERSPLRIEVVGGLVVVAVAAVVAIVWQLLVNNTKNVQLKRWLLRAEPFIGAVVLLSLYRLHMLGPATLPAGPIDDLGVFFGGAIVWKVIRWIGDHNVAQDVRRTEAEAKRREWAAARATVAAVKAPPVAPAEQQQPTPPKPIVTALLTATSDVGTRPQRFAVHAILQVGIYRYTDQYGDRVDWEYEACYLVRARPGGVSIKRIREDVAPGRVGVDDPQPIAEGRRRIGVEVDENLMYDDERHAGLTILNPDGQSDFGAHAQIVRISADGGCIQPEWAMGRYYELAWVGTGKDRVTITPGNRASLVLARGECVAYHPAGGRCVLNLIGWTDPERQRKRSQNVL